MKQRLDIKPLSVNEAFKGRRFKTPAYKRYERDVCLMLAAGRVPEGELSLKVDVGFSSAASDIDNILKPFIDCLQKRYKFNDKRIVELHIKKHKVGKGAEFIGFKLEAA